jgi:hypothetical protein
MKELLFALKDIRDSIGLSPIFGNIVAGIITVMAIFIFLTRLGDFSDKYFPAKRIFPPIVFRVIQFILISIFVLLGIYAIFKTFF